MNKLALFSAAIIATSIASAAQAYDQDTIVMGLGYTDPFGEDHAAIGTVEYRSPAINPDMLFGIDNVSWMAGIEADTDTSGYVFVGLLYDWALTERISLVPSVGAGFYRQGDGKDLGGAFEFRDTIELNYKITDTNRIGLMLSHKSNASLYDQNPGTEVIQVNYSVGLQ